MDNWMELSFPSLSVNESFARSAVAAFAASLNPTLDELSDLRTAVSEAVTNAILHGYDNRPEGRVFLRCEKQDRTITVTVRDTGCGIEPKDLPYIWERFYKVDKSRMRTSGTGLGLAIAKLLAELMHGSVGVNSEPGVGADFWLELPLGAPDDEQ